jgi:hypothetical protein
MVTELGEKRGQQAIEMALGGVLEVKVMIGDQGEPLFSHALDILNDSGASWINFYKRNRKRVCTKECFFQHQLQN